MNHKMDMRKADTPLALTPEAKHMLHQMQSLAFALPQFALTSHASPRTDDEIEAEFDNMPV